MTMTIMKNYTISGPHTHVVPLGSGNFPAWQMPNGDLALDLRMCDEGVARLDAPALRDLRVPEAAIRAAMTSSPEVGWFVIGAQS